VTIYNSLCSFIRSKTEQNTPPTTKQPHIVHVPTCCMSTVHAFDVSAVVSHYELHRPITTPFTDALLSMKNCGNFCHASMVARFSPLTKAKTSLTVYHLLNSTQGPDGIIHRIQVRAIWWPYVWLNELHVLRPVGRCEYCHSLWRRFIFTKYPYLCFMYRFLYLETWTIGACVWRIVSLLFAMYTVCSAFVRSLDKEATNLYTFGT